jgi:hypothetical protein
LGKDLAGLERGQLDGEGLEGVLWRNVVLYGELELFFAEGRASYSLYFVVGKGSREQIGKDVIVVIAEFELGPVIAQERS